ncbi:MAG: hypothetical protein LBP55_06565 [Candidatus Adiutrix sp.]|jgi:heptose II phosphotransferase|nr:hypothetical protein [Candidatus Adiutrix sp.]
MTINSSGRPAPRPAFRKAEQDGFQLRYLSDGVDYPALLADFRQGRIEFTLLNARPCQETYLVKYGGRAYVIKRDFAFKPPVKKRRFWDLLAGTPFTRQMRETWRAIGRGCRIVPEIYLVAEKIAGYRLCADSYLILQFIEGRTCTVGAADTRWLAGLAATVAKLHTWGLASGAPHAGNLVEADEGWKMIDVSSKGPIIITQAHDLLDMKRKLNLEVPTCSWPLKFVSALVQAKYRLHLWRRKHIKPGGLPR